ncbi:ATP-binding cassette domain-containing protein [Lacticaseibacillus daqingensis]|uniref:ATP-binding cassette domain-containing protein n=1 Tax=Lacticaseibacillus daqingensis TaxID=2486014 RepID=UPI000F78857E|nr:ABC transporter ATP-binding protein [Lacticaseibacillus daqingensis]
MIKALLQKPFINKRLLALTLLFAALTALEGVVTPYALGGVTDAITHRSMSGVIRAALIGAIGLIVIRVAFFLMTYFMAKLRQAATTTLRQQLLEAGLARTARTESATLLAKMFGDVKQIEQSAVIGLVYMLYSLLLATAATLYIFSINWQVATLFILFPFLSLTIPLLTKKPVKRASQLWSTRNASYTTAVTEAFQARRLILVYGRQPYFLARSRQVLDAEQTASVRISVMQAVITFFSATLELIGMYLPFVVGAVFVLRGQLTVGALLSVFLASDRIVSPVASSINYYGQLVAAQPLIDEIATLTAPAATEPALQAVGAGPVVALQNVRYQPADRAILTGVNLAIQPHTRTLVVGNSGAGKSTLIDLMVGLANPAAGTVAVAAASVPAYLAQIAYVAQAPRVFSESLAFNLTLGENADEPALLAALRQAGLAELATAAQLHERLGEGGRQLSGGELKKLDIARALLHQRALTIIDEGLSGLDAKSAASVSAVIRQLPGTIIEVEHRVPLAAMADYDQILVVADGHVTALAPDQTAAAVATGLFI